METAAAIDQYSQPQSTINNEKQREVARPPPKGAERLLVFTEATVRGPVEINRTDRVLIAIYHKFTMTQSPFESVGTESAIWLITEE